MERKVFINFIDKIITPGYDFELENTNSLNILNENTMAPAVIYSNHTSAEDPFLLSLVVSRYSPQSMANLIIPVSEHHAKFNKSPAYFAGVKLGKSLGIEMPEVVQSYRAKGEPENTELQDKSSKLSMSLSRLLMQRLPGGSKVILYPEGHRNGEGFLLPAESGIGFMLTLMERLKEREKIDEGYFIPVFTRYSEEGDRIKYNLHNKPKVSMVFGNPLSVNDIINESSTFGNKRQQSRIASHILMKHVADMMPPGKRGFYSDELFMDTLSGRFELKLGEDGKAFVYDNQNRQ